MNKGQEMAEPAWGMSHTKLTKTCYNVYQHNESALGRSRNRTWSGLRAVIDKTDYTIEA